MCVKYFFIDIASNYKLACTYSEKKVINIKTSMKTCVVLLFAIYVLRKFLFLLIDVNWSIFNLYHLACMCDSVSVAHIN